MLKSLSSAGLAEGDRRAAGQGGGPQTADSSDDRRIRQTSKLDTQNYRSRSSEAAAGRKKGPARPVPPSVPRGTLPSVTEDVNMSLRLGKKVFQTFQRHKKENTK